MFKLFLLLTFLMSCSRFNYLKKEFPFNYRNNAEVEDYREHLSHIAKSYISSNKSKLIKVSNSSKKYLFDLVNRIKNNNEIIFQDKAEIKLYLVKDSRPFIFSLPNGYYFISRGLVNNYIRSEDIFISMFVYELIRNELTIYKKISEIPYEKSTLSRVLQVTNLELETRNELNILTYKVLKRAGFDPEARLLWIQMVNKNSIDFSIMYESPNVIPKEEYLFKNYISNNKSDNFEYERNSTRSFYSFRQRLRRL